MFLLQHAGNQTVKAQFIGNRKLGSPMQMLENTFTEIVLSNQCTKQIL